jgi:hypothetical protein
MVGNVDLESWSKADVTTLNDIELQFFGSAQLTQLVPMIAQTFMNSPLARLNISTQGANVSVTSLLKDSISTNVVRHDFLHDEDFLLARLLHSIISVDVEPQSLTCMAVH